MSVKNVENKYHDLSYIFHKIQNNVFHIKTQNQLSDSILNFFTMAIGFFMFGCINAEILFSNEIKYFFYGTINIAGITLVVLGIYEWYKGKSLYILINFSYGLLFISWFLKYILIENQELEKNKMYEGALYIAWFILSLLIIFAVKNKGIFYSLNYFGVAVGFAFIFIDKYADQEWSKLTYGYIFVVTGCLFWITGLLRLSSSSFLHNNLEIVKE